VEIKHGNYTVGLSLRIVWNVPPIAKRNTNSTSTSMTTSTSTSTTMCSFDLESQALIPSLLSLLLLYTYHDYSSILLYNDNGVPNLNLFHLLVACRKGKWLDCTVLEEEEDIDYSIDETVM